MFPHPDIMLWLARDRQQELIAEADRDRLLTAALRHRRAARAAGVTGLGSAPATNAPAATGDGQPAATPCSSIAA